MMGRPSSEPSGRWRPAVVSASCMHRRITVDRATRTSGTRVRVSRLTRRRLITGALGASGLLLLAGCAPPAPASAPVASAPPKAEAPTAAPVVAAAPTTAAPAAAPKTAAPAGKAVETAQVAAAISVNYVPLFVGIEKGIFLKHGLDLQL